MDKTNALAVLEDALECCRREDMRTAEVYSALDFLEAHAVRKWPFDQFRDALENSTSGEGRWQVLNASLMRSGWRWRINQNRLGNDATGCLSLPRFAGTKTPEPLSHRPLFPGNTSRIYILPQPHKLPYTLLHLFCG
jgi:hypothetical protein